MSTGNRTGWTASTETFGQKHLLPQGTGSERSPSCKMPQSQPNVEPPNTWSVVLLQHGLGFPVRTVLNLLYSESNRLGTTALNFRRGVEAPTDHGAAGRSAQGLVFPAGK